MIEYIQQKNEIYAIILRSSYQEEGIKFLTPDNFSQQLGYMKRPKGYVIQPHIHNEIKRSVTLTQEVLFVKTGKVKVNFYDNDKIFKESVILQKGDFILLAAGGHGFEMLEQSELIEVKQGPYSGDGDKTRF